MNLIINDRCRQVLTHDKIIEFVEHLKTCNPLISKQNKRIWDAEFLNYKVFVKNFLYKNTIVKNFKRTGIKNFKISEILLKKSIKCPLPLFYYSRGLEEFIATERIDAVDLWRFLEKNNTAEIHAVIENKLNVLIDKFDELNLYHPDFNITNLLITQDMDIYIVDLDGVKFNLNKRRKKKMIGKINKYLRALSGIEL